MFGQVWEWDLWLWSLEGWCWPKLPSLIITPNNALSYRLRQALLATEGSCFHRRVITTPLISSGLQVGLVLNTMETSGHQLNTFCIMRWSQVYGDKNWKIMTPKWLSCRGVELWWFTLFVNTTGSRITQETNVWACLWRFLGGLIEVRRPTLTSGSTTQWARVPE